MLEEPRLLLARAVDPLNRSLPPKALLPLPLLDRSRLPTRSAPALPARLPNWPEPALPARFAS
jgi:hypothetical protein